MPHDDLYAQQERLPNRLPQDGEAYYLERVLDAGPASDALARCLEELDWEHERVTMFGREIVTRRKIAWYADTAMPYAYSGRTRVASPWADCLLALKARVEKASHATFNACLCNLYHCGEEGMGWHSDDERTLVPDGVIASLTLGDARRFSFKHKASGERVSLELAHGSLLIMQGETQAHWLHALPKTRKSRSARVNLTFRQMR